MSYEVVTLDENTLGICSTEAPCIRVYDLRLKAVVASLQGLSPPPFPSSPGSLHLSPSSAGRVFSFVRHFPGFLWSSSVCVPFSLSVCFSRLEV